MASSHAAGGYQDPAKRRVQRDLDGRTILFDGEGFFMHAEDWSRPAARILAREAGLADLTERHWKVIEFLRKYYLENGRIPLNVQLKNGTGMSLLELEALFPGGIKLGARRISGLPNPKSCM
jgi:tRNA 2-thiouridine synthesizing protein E